MQPSTGVWPRGRLLDDAAADRLALVAPGVLASFSGVDAG